METQQLTQLLTILLIASIVILFVLTIAFIIISVSKKAKEKKENEEVVKVKEELLKATNIVQTKAYTSENIKKFMDFDEIKDNMIIQKDGKKLIMVVQCNGVNYDLMSGIEKVGVEKGFVQFLNTLTRPIQIYVQSRKVNLEESVFNYNKRLKEIEQKYNKIKSKYEQAQKNTNINEKEFKDIRFEYIRQKNLYEYTKDIILNTEKMSLNKNILTKNYYIVISYYPDNSEDLFKKDELIDMAFSELYTNAQAILRTLSVCGITGKVLDSTELADLLYVAYNRDSSEIYGVDKAIQAGYDALYTTAPDVINKKIEELDKIIKERGYDLANDAIEKATLKCKRQKELELKEKNLDNLIKATAKNLIKENEGYISEEVSKESIKQIEGEEEKSNNMKKIPRKEKKNEKQS